MLTQENDVEIHALAARGWNQSAISRHTGRDRKTVRKYLAAGVVVRERAASCLEPWRAYIAERFVDDPHLPAVTLLEELAAAGFDRSYPSASAWSCSNASASRPASCRAATGTSVVIALPPLVVESRKHP